MASPLRLTLLAARNADDVWVTVRHAFETAEQVMSRFRLDSEITRLNEVAGTDAWCSVSRTLLQALVACDRAWRLTGGRFDPRVLADLVRLGDVGAPLPVTSGRGMAGPIVERGADGAVRLEHAVDLGGIGKGLALRWAARILETAGVGGYLLEAGGDLVAGGDGPDRGPWRIDLEDPRGRADALAVLSVGVGAVTTSSVQRRHWEHEGRAVHHLVDPRTGEPADGGLLAVTVAGPDPAWAEIWSKTLFIGGHAGIAREARGRGLAAWWVTDTGDLEMTAAARARTLWVAAEASESPSAAAS